MKLLVISANPLFTEVLNAALEGRGDYKACISAPDEATRILTQAQPDVIIVDESLGPERYEGILMAARERTSSRVLLISLEGNELLILNSRREIIHKTEDLCKALRGESAL